MSDIPPQEQTPDHPTRRRRTDAERLVDMQTELARLQEAREDRAPALQRAITKETTPKRGRSKATRSRRKPHVPGAPRGDGDALDSELRKLVAEFVAALRVVIRRELIAQAKKRLS